MKADWHTSPVSEHGNERNAAGANAVGFLLGLGTADARVQRMK